MPRDGLDWNPALWAFRFALFNPHAAIQIRGIGAADAGFKQAKSGDDDSAIFGDLSFSPSEAFPGGRWRKFLPTDLTPANWYSLQEFSALVHLKADRDPSVPLGNFVREFRGMSRAWRQIVSSIGIATLGELAASPFVISELRVAMVKAAEPPKPEVLGRVGADHFRAHFEGTFGIVEERFWYKHRFGTADGLPYMVDVAIAETKHDGGKFFGLN